MWHGAARGPAQTGYCPRTPTAPTHAHSVYTKSKGMSEAYEVECGIFGKGYFFIFFLPIIIFVNINTYDCISNYRTNF